MWRKVKAAPDIFVPIDSNQVVQWHFTVNTEHVPETASANFGNKIGKLGVLYQGS
jgi:hypothetical protein